MNNKSSNRITKNEIKNKYTSKDLDDPKYSPSYDQDAVDNLYEYVTQNMVDDEF